MTNSRWAPMGILLVCLSVLTIALEAQLGTKKDPSWAFQVIDPVLPPTPEETGPIQVPGSTKTYTRADIENLSAPPDWFPEVNAPKPASFSADANAQLMKGPVAQLTDDDIVAIAAYLGSLPPAP